MFDDSSLKIKLYIYAPLFFGIGAFFGFRGWYWAGVLTWIVGGVLTAHIAIVSVIRERTRYMESQTEYYKQMVDFYNKLESMDAEAKYIAGLAYVPAEVTVKKQNNEYSQTWQNLPITPYKLKTIAQATINGEGFTVRKWAGDGKLLSRQEWDTLHEAMEKLGMLEAVDPNVPTLGYVWTSFGIDVMTQVVKDSL
jgi:hypothetical protein